MDKLISIALIFAVVVLVKEIKNELIKGRRQEAHLEDSLVKHTDFLVDEYHNVYGQMIEDDTRLINILKESIQKQEDRESIIERLESAIVTDPELSDTLVYLKEAIKENDNQAEAFGLMSTIIYRRERSRKRNIESLVRLTSIKNRKY